MERAQAYTILTTYLHNKNLLKHCLATEAAMEALYIHLKPTEQQTEAEKHKWSITGLLHDADYELAQKTDKLEQHGLLLFEKEVNTIPDDIAYAIKSHNYQNTKVMPQLPMDWAITTCDQLTGLIVAAALIHPEKKLAAIDTAFVMKRFGEKAFAKGASRETIALCEEKLHIPLEQFVTIVLTAMQGIHIDLGL